MSRNSSWWDRKLQKFCEFILRIPTTPKPLLIARNNVVNHNGSLLLQCPSCIIESVLSFFTSRYRFVSLSRVCRVFHQCHNTKLASHHSGLHINLFDGSEMQLEENANTGSDIELEEKTNPMDPVVLVNLQPTSTFRFFPQLIYIQFLDVYYSGDTVTMLTCLLSVTKQLKTLCISGEVNLRDFGSVSIGQLFQAQTHLRDLRLLNIICEFDTAYCESNCLALSMFRQLNLERLLLFKKNSACFVSKFATNLLYLAQLKQLSLYNV